jgi:hypothetical protein
MKEKEMPKKIYLFDYNDAMVTPLEGDTVYIREDAFIKKACEWIKESITNNPEYNRIISKKGVITMGLLIEDFKKYMKRE